MRSVPSAARALQMARGFLNYVDPSVEGSTMFRAERERTYAALEYLFE